MFFIISKIIYFLIQPLVWIAFFLLGAVFSKNTIRKKKFTIAALLLLFVFSNTFIFNTISNAWESQISPYDPSLSNEQFDIAIILGGIIHFDRAREQYAFHGNGERLFNVLPLYFNGKVKKILFAGGSGSLSQRTSEAIVAEQYLLGVGVAQEDIILEKESRNTYENITFALKLLPSQEQKILLSTSATHMPRAMEIFRKQNVFPTAFPVDYESIEQEEFSLDQLFIPNPKVLNQWYWLIHEWVGIFSYRLVGYC